MASFVSRRVNSTYIKQLIFGAQPKPIFKIYFYKKSPASSVGGAWDSYPQGRGFEPHVRRTSCPVTGKLYSGIYEQL